MRAIVPVCDFCQKPHFGKNSVEDRCVCDTSGHFQMKEIEVDEPELTESNK